MSYPGIYHVLEDAAPKIRYKTEQLREKTSKFFKREVRKFPAWKYYEYTIPATKDTYIIYFYAENALAADKPISGSFCYLRHWDPCKVMIIGAIAPEVQAFKMECKVLFDYSIHFFERYRERLLKNTKITIIETICRFFSKNGLIFNLCDADNRLWNGIKDEITQERIEGKYALQLRDGLELAQGIEFLRKNSAKDSLPEMIVFTALTFVSRDMYFSDQSDSSNEQAIIMAKNYLETAAKFPTDPRDFAEILWQNSLRERIKDLESTLNNKGDW